MILKHPAAKVLSIAIRSPPGGVVNVSLTEEDLSDIGEQFKTENLGASVEFLMAVSSDLITQLT